MTIPCKMTIIYSGMLCLFIIRCIQCDFPIGPTWLGCVIFIHPHIELLHYYIADKVTWCRMPHADCKTIFLIRRGERWTIKYEYICESERKKYRFLTTVRSIIFQRKRSTSAATIRMPYNSNAQSSFVELVLVVDNKVFKGLGENLKKTHARCQDIANIINAVSGRATCMHSIIKF